MKDVILTRAWSGQMATLGMIKVVGVDHDPIFTLENPLRSTDVDSRIDSGRYVCESYSGTIYKNVYRLLDVPRRTDILIHAGNKEGDTLGCILLGLYGGTYKEEPFVGRSKLALDLFRGIIGDNKFYLNIYDGADL